MEGAKRVPDPKSRKNKRKEVLERKKAIDDAIKAVSLVKDHLASFPAFKKYDRNGLCLYLESSSGDQLSSFVKCYIRRLLKDNMEGPYGQQWPTEEKIKHREAVAPEARYIFVREAPHIDTLENSSRDNEEFSRIPWAGDGDRLVGFVHYRFTVEEDVPVIYVYELQLEPCVQGKGLGKFLMQLIELIGRKNHMGAAMLTVQKANISAMNFYMHKLRYSLSSISPSRVDPLVGAEMNYEILCKTFNQEAKTKLE